MSAETNPPREPPPAALIFDLDGLLINSEPTWKTVEIDILGSVGVPLTWEMTEQTMGMRMLDVVRFWRERFPWNGPNDREVEQRTVHEVIKRLCASGSLQPGAERALNAAVAHKIPTALATSSPLHCAEQLLTHFGLREHFSVVHSAEKEIYGKPHPAVFLSAARLLGVHQRDCLVLEDSVNGVLAAKAARMYCIAVPDAEFAGDKRFTVADSVIASLEVFAAKLEKRGAEFREGQLEVLL